MTYGSLSGNLSGYVSLDPKNKTCFSQIVFGTLFLTIIFPSFMDTLNGFFSLGALFSYFSASLVFSSVFSLYRLSSVKRFFVLVTAWGLATFLLSFLKEHYFFSGLNYLLGDYLMYVVHVPLVILNSILIAFLPYSKTDTCLRFNQYLIFFMMLILVAMIVLGFLLFVSKLLIFGLLLLAPLVSFAAMCLLNLMTIDRISKIMIIYGAWLLGLTSLCNIEIFNIESISLILLFPMAGIFLLLVTLVSVPLVYLLPESKLDLG